MPLASRIALVFVSIALAATAHARLGETMAQLIERLGEPLNLGKMTVFTDGNSREVGIARTFRLEDWRVDVVMVDDICARIRYAKVGDWTEEQIAGVLDANNAGLKWTEQTPAQADSRKWLRTDGATAIWVKTGITLELPLFAQRLDERKSGSRKGNRRAKE